MPAMFVAILAGLLSIPTAVTAQEYIVWSSVIFARTGERTPEVLGYIPTTLTSLGATQAYNAGAFFRDRYISTAASEDGLTGAPLQGLSANSIDSLQLYAATIDEQYSIASAQAFLQGLYPPFKVNTSTCEYVDATSALSNGSCIQSPLSGYQYPQIHVAGALDADFPYLGGSLDCPSFDDSADAYASTAAFAATESESRSYYQAIGNALLGDVLGQDAWDYTNAYAIYDYLNYQNAHNTTAAALLSQPDLVDQKTGVSYLNMLKWYADQQQYAELGNLTAKNNYSDPVTSWPSGVTGSISTIAGNMLAARVLAQLQIAAETEDTYYSLSLLFGDFEPLMSFFALTGLPNLNSYFYGLPDFGSVAVFELFSWGNNTLDTTYSNADDLWVRFYFRNGTDGSNQNGNFQSYPLFNRGPSETDMTWTDFQNAMNGILIGDIGDWCTQCGADRLFCAAWNSSDATTNSDSDSTSTATSSSHSGLKPAIAGVIGAIVALAIASLIFAAVMLLGGLRFHRVQSRRKSEMGGFKGGQKMASDPDLTISKGGAVVGASVEREPDSPISPIGHERVGSWELKNAEAGRANIAAPGEPTRPSFEQEDETLDPFRNPAVRPEEHV